MALLEQCGNCGSIGTMPGLNTVQCLDCGWVTRNDGTCISADERFTKTLHQKHQEIKDPGSPMHEHEVPIEG